MGSITAVELGADTCAFARTSVRGAEVRLTAAEILDPAAFPGLDAFTAAVRQTRRTLRLPRRCRAVLWGLPDGANRKDAAVKPLLAPLTGAGFKVERVVSPCNALAAIARLRHSRGEGSTCWLAINRGGVAVVVVRPGKLLYSHSFAWDSSIGSSGSQARLLQRYSLVSFLAPEVKRAMAEALKSGTPVDAVVTCGNLPDLRSLTMPLIEELDVEVETLDSLEGLIVKPQVAEKLAESAPAIRLACAGAIARGTRPWDPSKKRSGSGLAGMLMRAAILAAAVVGIGYAWYSKTRPSPPPVPPPRTQPAAATTNLPPKLPAPAVSVPLPPVTTSNPPAASVPPSRIEVRDPRIEKPQNDPRTSILEPRAPAVSVPATASKSNPPAVSVPPSRIEVRDPTIEKPRNDPRPSTLDPRAPAVSVPPPATKSNPPAVSVPATASKSNPPATKAAVNAGRPPLEVPAPRTANTVPGIRANPVVTLPFPNTPAPTAPRAAAGAPPSRIEVRDPRIEKPQNDPRPSIPDPRAPAVSMPPARIEVRDPRIEKPRNDPRTSIPDPRAPAMSVPARTNPVGLNAPSLGTDKLEAAPSAVRSPQTGVASRGGSSARGPAPPLLRDAVPKVTAILVSRDRRFATIEGGQIIGIGDLLGRRTVVGMDERSVVFQEPSGTQIRMGLGGRLLGVERAAR